MSKNTMMLNMAQSYADEHSTCLKVKVGSCIIPRAASDLPMALYGCNHGTYNCKENGCRRIKLYGDASKEHRLPSDCDALHSEVDAICAATRYGVNLRGATIYVTRYPCEACARAIVNSGITRVVYGRSETISPYTATIFHKYNIEVTHEIGWEREDNNE